MTLKLTSMLCRVASCHAQCGQLAFSVEDSLSERLSGSSCCLEGLLLACQRTLEGADLLRLLVRLPLARTQLIPQPVCQASISTQCDNPENLRPIQDVPSLLLRPEVPHTTTASLSVARGPEASRVLS